MLHAKFQEMSIENVDDADNADDVDETDDGPLS